MLRQDTLARGGTTASYFRNDMTNNMLEVSGLRKRFGGIVANDDISLEVERGAIVGLI